MSNFFDDLNETTKSTNNLIERNPGLTPERQAIVDQVEKERDEWLKNRDRYQVALPQEQYDIINNAIANAEIPEDEAYRWAAALVINQKAFVPLDEAYRNLEAYNQAIFGEEHFVPKTNFKAIVDCFQLGENTLKQGFLGNKLMIADMSGNAEEAERLLKEIEQLDAENLSMIDHQDRRWWIEALKFSAQSAPFTGYVATAGLLGSVISGGFATGLSFAASMQNAQGLEYIALRKEGASKENALAVSVFSGILQAYVENAIGINAALLGKHALGAAAKKTLTEKIAGNVFKRLHYNGTFASIALKMGSEYVKENFEEGMEEVIQDAISKSAHAFAAELEDYDIEPITAKKLAEDAWENFKGGAMGALGLGVFSTAYNTAAEVYDYNLLKTAAETIPSKEVFVNTGKESPVLEGMSDPQKTEILEKLYDNKQAKRDENIQKEQEDIAEVFEADDETDIITDENGNEIVEEKEFKPEYRNEEGSLVSEYAEPTENEDGTYSSRVDFYDPESEGSGYGHLSYTVDEENGTVKIDEFKTKKAYNYLRNEMYTELAGKFSGYDIVWDTKGKRAASIKEDLEALNPRGKASGLNYFEVQAESEQYKADHKVKQTILKDLEANTKLKATERAGIVAIMDAIAKHQKKTLSDWYNGTFMQEGMFGDINELQEQAKAKGTTAAGGMVFKETLDGARAVIYAAENADFSTMAHELSHVWQKQLFGEDAAEAARIFGASEVMDNNGNITYNWNDRTIKTNKLDENGNPVYISPAENFAYSFEKWLKDGKAPSKEQENVFKKFAEFMKHVIETLRNYIDMKPEIQEFFDKNLKVTDAMMNQAENEQVLKWESDYAKQQQTNAAEETQNNEDAEVTENAAPKEFNEEEAVENEALSEEEFNALTEGMTETSEALKETKLDDTTQAALNEINEDPDIPAEKKNAALLKATSEDYEIKQANIERYKNRTDLTEEEKAIAIEDVNNNNTTDGNGGGQSKRLLELGKDMVFQKDIDFQIIGTNGAAQIDEANGEEWRSQKLLDAQDMDLEGKTAKEIREVTGWEKGADGRWKYEIPDFTINENVETSTKEYLDEESALLIPSDGSDENGKYQIVDPFIKLSDLIAEDNDLFKAYPELKNVQIIKGTNDERLRGSYVGNFIYFNDKYFTETESGNFTLKDPNHTLNHEVQHYIQNHEYFAKGGNEESARENLVSAVRRKNGTTSYYNGKVEAYYEAQNNIDKLNYVLSLRKYMDNPEAFRKSGNWFKYGSAFGVPKNKQDRINYLYEVIEKWADETRAKLFEYDYEFWELNNKQDQELKKDLSKEKYKEKKYSEEAGKWLKAEAEIQELSKLSGYELYKRLAGEVEARNVQARANMTEEERRNTLLSETEDIARNDQLVVFQEAIETRKEELLHEDTEEEKAIKQLMSELQHQGFYSLHDAAVKSLRDGDSIEFDAKSQHNLEVMQHLLDTNKGLMFYEEGSDRFRTVTENIHPDQSGKYQVTYWDAKGPIMHIIHNDAKGILEDIMQNENVHAKNENEDILFQEPDGSYYVAPDELLRAVDILKDPEKYPEDERIRIEKNLNEHKGTAYAALLVYSINIRDDIKTLMAGKDLPETSKIKRYKNVISFLKKGEKGLFDYFEYKSTILGENDKTVNAVGGSAIHCNPSKACAKYCYVATGTGQYANNIMKSEMVDIAISLNPVKAAELVAHHYLGTEEGKQGYNLRVLDKGDLSKDWIPFIDKLNELGVGLTVFSKRPEFLSQIDKSKNILLLSIDSTNEYLAEQYPDFAIALVVGEDEGYLVEKYKDRFLNHNGVILPVKGNNVKKDVRFKLVQDMPQWAKGYAGKRGFVCPINAEWKEIGNPDETPGTWNCTMCDRFGWGCYVTFGLKDRPKLSSNIIKMTIGELNAYNRKLEALVRKVFPNATDEEIRRFVEDQAELVDSEFGNINTTGSRTEPAGYRGPGSGSGEIQEGTSGVLSGSIDFQEEINQISHQDLKKDEEYRDAINRKDFAKARQMLQEKAEAVNAAIIAETDTPTFSVRTKPAPTKTKKIYKAFNIENGKPTALYVSEGIPIPVGVWLDAKDSTHYMAKNGRYYVPAETGDSHEFFDDAQREEFFNKGLIKKRNAKSWKGVAYRPGWHGGDLPFFPQGGLKNTTVKQYTGVDLDVNAHSFNQVIYECEIDASEDFTSTHLTKDGKVAFEDYQEMKPGFYEYSTNALNRANDLGKWYISDSLKIIRPLTQAECDTILKENGYNPQAWQQYQEKSEGRTSKKDWYTTGEMILEKLGIDPAASDKYKKILDITYDGNGELIPLSQRMNTSKPDILFQEAYHGTSADFDNFDLNYGLSGEGSMAFGYGVYVSGSEDIARDYATRQREDKNGSNVEYRLNMDLELLSDFEKELNEFPLLEEWLQENQKSIDNVTEKIKQKKANNETTEMLDRILKAKVAKNSEEGYKTERSHIEGKIRQVKRDIEAEQAELEKVKAKGEVKRHLYTVEIPDNKLIKWDGNIRRSTIEKIKNALFRKLAYEPNDYGEYEYKGVENELKRDLNNAFNSEYTGESLYGTVASYIGGDKKASQFLSSLGYKGIDYPAGTNFGIAQYSKERNYVIFNEKDAKIISNIVFQEQVNEVRSQYENTNKWLKAPNGSDTKLTEKQWLQVRTPNFKKWFGDWENDPQSASKVVDENGEPLVMYHGTRAEDKFEIFDTPPAGNKDNIGSHFGPKSTAEEFSDTHLYEVFLNIKKPFRPNFDFFADELDNAYLSELIHMKNEINTEEANEIFKKIYDIYPDLKSYELENMSDEDILDNFENDENLDPIIPNARDGIVNIMYELMKAGGYDGMRYNNWYEGEFNNECFVVINPNQIKSATDNNGNFSTKDPSILFQEAEPGTEFQTVYHGSPYVLRKAGGDVVRGEELGFDHSKMGTGEGNQSYGWGSYVTQVKGIAESYAGMARYKKDFILRDDVPLDQSTIIFSRYDFDLNFSLNKDPDGKKQVLRNLESKKRLLEAYQEKWNNLPEKDKKYYEENSWDVFNDAANIKSVIFQAEYDIEMLEDILADKFTIVSQNQNVYTLEIPEDGENFLQWEKDYPAYKFGNDLYDYLISHDEDGSYKGDAALYLRNEITDAFAGEMNGGEIYRTWQAYLGSDKETSEALQSMGYTGISYPADFQNGGREDGARNFVIFNENDIHITDWHAKDVDGNFLFQSDFENGINDEILNEAAQFDSWVEYMEYGNVFGIEGKPEEAAGDWYKNVWEIAHNISPTSKEMDEAAEREKIEKAENSKKDPAAITGDFLFNIKKPGALEAFLKMVYQILHVDEETYASMDPDEQQYMSEIVARTEKTFNHGTWRMNISRVYNGKPLTDRTRKQMLTFIRQRPRDYQAIYADITGQEKYRVEAAENGDVELFKRGRKFNHVKYLYEIENMSPEEKSKLDARIKDDEIREKFKKDNVKMLDPDVEHYIDMVEAGKDKLADELAKQRRDFNEDIERLAGMQERDIIRQYNEYLNLKAEADERKIRMPAGLKNIVKRGEDFIHKTYRGRSRNYNNLVEDWDEFKNQVEAKVKVQERLRSENKIQELEEKIRAEYDAKRMKTLMSKAEKLNAMQAEYNQKREEAAALKKLKDMRKALVKRVMRRVNFAAIDYTKAKEIIAVQKVFEPNMRGGVNKWIGTENKLAREIWSAWNTDSEVREDLMNSLMNKGKFEIIRLLDDTKNEEDFEKLSKKDQKKIEKAMPRQNWIKDLGLDVWKKERDNTLQLDIKEVERTVWITDENGNRKEKVITTTEISPDVEELLINAIGQDMTNAIRNKHFEDWTTGEMEELARRINKMFKDGRDLYAAKREAEKNEADRIRKMIRDAINNTGIVINDDDPEDVKKKKQEKINKILGTSQELPGTAANQKEKQQTILDRLLHSYHDANVRRVARILDNYSEGTMTNLLYWEENECFNKQERAKDRRNKKIEDAIKAGNIDIRKLGKTVTIEGFTFTYDEILMIHAADMNNAEYANEQLKENPDMDPKDIEEESAYKAIKYGNLITAQEREAFQNMDADILENDQKRKDNLQAAILANNEEDIKKYQAIPSNSVDIDGNIIMAGTAELKALATSRLNNILQQTENIKNEMLPLIEAIRKDYSEEFDRINKVSIDVFNAPLWREKWYLPLIRKTMLGDTHEQRLRQDLLGHSAGTGKAGTEKGFTKKRVEIGPLHQAPVELGLYTTWADSVERNEHFIAYAGYIRQLNRILFSQDAMGTMQELENRYGKSMKDYLDVYVKEVANPNVSEPKKGLDRVMHFLRGNTAPAYLGWKFSSILKQGIESPAPFMQFINPVEYMHGAMQLATKKWTRDGIAQKSAFMKSRVFDPMVDVINENVEKSFSKKSYYLKKFQQKGMEGLEWIDWACVAPGWIAIYEKEYAKLQGQEQAMYDARVAELTEQNKTRYGKFHLTEEQVKQQAMDDVLMDIEKAAVDKADDCVRLCQPSNRKVDLAPMFKNNSEAAKAVLQFQTALNVIWQNIRYDIPYAMRNKEATNIIGMVLGYVMAGIISGMVTEGLLKGDDDDPEEIAKRIGYYSTTQFIDSVPIVGGNLDALAKKAITGEGSSIYSSSLWPTFDRYYRAASAFVSEDYAKALRNMEQGLLLTTGAPLSGIKEIEAAIGAMDKEPGLELYPEAFLGRRK